MKNVHYNTPDKVVSFVPTCDMPMSFREREEKHFYHGYKVVSIIENELIELVDARLGATDGNHYCTVWLNTRYIEPEFYFENGFAYASAKAGGYGYHKASQALESAMWRAGMKFEIGCGGMGSQCMRDVLLAAGEYLAPKNAIVYLIECFG